MLIFALLATSLAAAPAAAPPVLTCVAATIGADGRIAERRVEVGSGNRAADRRALDYLGKLDLGNLSSLKVAAHSGYLLVAERRRGEFEIQLTEQRTFHASCDAAFAARNAS